jgi:glucokinase
LQFNPFQKQPRNYFLVSDIGGTWTRFAILADGEIILKKIFETKNYSSAELKIFANNFSSRYKKNISAAAIACAGKVEGAFGKEKCKLTHAEVYLDKKVLEGILNTTVFLLNDLEAEAYYVKKYGNDSLIIAIGTGLGVSVITDRGDVLATEDGHTIVDEIISSIKQLNKTKQIIEYEDILGGKNNLLYSKLFGEIKNDVGKIKKLNMRKDEFSILYSFVLEDFIFKMISIHKKNEIKKIFLSGGVVLGNKKYFRRFAKSMEKKMAVDIIIIEDEFAGLRGAGIYAAANLK